MRDLFCHAENLSNSRCRKSTKKEKARRQGAWPNCRLIVRVLLWLDSSGGRGHGRDRGPRGGSVHAHFPGHDGGFAPGGCVHRACAPHHAVSASALRIRCSHLLSSIMSSSARAGTTPPRNDKITNAAMSVLAFLEHAFPPHSQSQTPWMHQILMKPYEPRTKGVQPSFTLPWPGKSKEIAVTGLPDSSNLQADAIYICAV